MSFSSKVKEELCGINVGARHCQIAELTAIITLCGRIQITAEDTYRLFIHTENAAVAQKFFTLVKKAYNISCEVSLRRLKDKSGSDRNPVYTVYAGSGKPAERILRSAKLLSENGDIREDLSLVSNLVVLQSCCKKAFVRGAFLCSGSMSSPEKGYHFEIVAPTMPKAEQLCELINTFGLGAKITQRKSKFVVYLKEGEQIVDILNIMGAHVSLMDLENVRILKEVRNSVNRQVNCEAANINKTVKAATSQIEDIMLIRDRLGFEKLSPVLREMAEVRLENPESSLTELASMLDAPIGKAGVNHRLKKLNIIADSLRGN